MQVGIISDIHGNLQALERVWETLDQRGLTDGIMLNAGDHVGYGTDPEGCITFLKSHPNVHNVQGNYDKNVALFPEREAEYRKKWGRARPEKFDALRRDSAVISDAGRAWLMDLPRELELLLGDSKTLLTHYAPGSKQGLGRWTGAAELKEYAALTEARIVVCGHTHSPFVREAGGVLFVNPGTVGRSFYGGPAYAILTLEPGQPPRAELKQLTL